MLKVRSLAAFTYLLAVFFASNVLASKRQNSISLKQLDDNDVLEKSEVVFKFPTYAIRIPPSPVSRRRSKTTVNPVPVSCNSVNVTNSLNELRHKVQCIPREVVVAISAPNELTVAPNTVVVKRCGGLCSGGKKCITAKKKNVNFYVRSTDLKSTMVYCNLITVPEDVECKCGCVNKKKTKCLKDVQNYDDRLCKCVCINVLEHQKCLNKASGNFKWDPNNCECICKSEKRCTTGTFWMKDKCKCVRPSK